MATVKESGIFLARAMVIMFCSPCSAAALSRVTIISQNTVIKNPNITAGQDARA